MVPLRVSPFSQGYSTVAKNGTKSLLDIQRLVDEENKRIAATAKGGEQQVATSGMSVLDGGDGAMPKKKAKAQTGKKSADNAVVVEILDDTTAGPRSPPPTTSTTTS
jgi:hypothetical protein